MDYNKIYNKGFAVVADEIRKLAEQSTSSTKIIDDMVKKLQGDAYNTVKTVEMVEAIHKEQAKSVSVTQGQYNEIAGAIMSAEAAINVINEASQRMKECKIEVQNTIEALSAVAQQNAASTEQASAAMQQQTASIEEMSNASEGLSQIAQELQALIERFII